jgi:16S rRNA (guanine527-N7)-methyltransferase
VTEEEARAWVERTFDVPRETMERMDRFVALLADEGQRQNLVSAASLESVWTRHIADSAQLLRFAPTGATWADLGSGAGFPGLIVSLFHDGPVTLIESRRLRADFLERAADALAVAVEILPCRAERVTGRKFGVVSARAFAPLDRLLEIGAPLATPETIWILPKGRNAKSELAARDSSWQGRFHVEPSLTDQAAGIVIAEQVSRPRKRKPE